VFEVDIANKDKNRFCMDLNSRKSAGDDQDGLPNDFARISIVEQLTAGASPRPTAAAI